MIEIKSNKTHRESLAGKNNIQTKFKLKSKPHNYRRSPDGSTDLEGIQSIPAKTYQSTAKTRSKPQKQSANLMHKNSSIDQQCKQQQLRITNQY